MNRANGQREVITYPQLERTQRRGYSHRGREAKDFDEQHVECLFNNTDEGFRTV